MKRAKLLSLFLAGSLLFQTAGIDAMATAPSEPAPISETVEGTENVLPDQPAEEKKADGQPSDEEKPKDPAGEETNPQQPSDEEKDKDTIEDENTPDQPSEGDKDPAEEGDSDQPSDEEKDDDPAEEETPEQPSEEDTEDNDPIEETEENNESVSENSVSENTVSENTLPEESEASIFSIFPGLGENYQFSAKELADKRVLASHVGDVVHVSSMENATLADFKDASDKYALGEVVYLAETREEAEQIAAAFGGTLQSYSYEVAVIGLPEQATVALAVAAAAEPEIKLPAVWPNYYNYLHTDTNATVDPWKPTDAQYDHQWFHDYIGTRYAWAAGYKGQGIKVAVIDTGVSRNHEDLQANAEDGKTFVNGANGTVHTTDNDTHGTHVAGIIAADDNAVGGVGIAPDAKVRGYSVFAADGSCTTDWILSAIRAAVADGNHIINMSLGSPSYSQPYEEVIDEAYNAGVAIFASSGNDDTTANNFPAAYAHTISIGAVDENGARAPFSSYGSTVNLSFPGVDIYSTTNEGYTLKDANGNTVKTYGKYDYMDGTSMACPAAAGTAAVILSARPDILKQAGKARVNALLSAMKSSTTKCTSSGMGAGTTYLPGVLKIATDMTAPETPVITVEETVNNAAIPKKGNAYLAESINVTLSTKTAVGVDIYYSTDGKTPAYKNGAITNAASTTPYRLGDKITLTGAKNKTIKAIAVNPFSGKVSKVASKTVTLTPIPTGVTVAPVGNVKKVVAGKSLKFTATVEPAYAISKNVQWTVTDATDAAKDLSKAGIKVSNGTVSTNAKTTPAGTYKVTATAVGTADNKFTGGKTDSFTFTVIASSNIKKVAFVDPATQKAPKAKSIKVGDNKTADADNQVINLANYLTVTQAGATSKDDKVITGDSALAEVVWSSSNTKIASVSDAGVITAVAPGKATIKATSNDGTGKSASYTVTVVQPVTGITISGPQKVAVGKSIALTATVAPANATNKKLEWTISGDGKLVSIGKSNGKVSTKKGASGEYTVKAAAADKLGATAASYTITIENQEITEIKLNKNKLTLFPPNTSATAGTTTETLTKTIKGKTNGSTTAAVITTSLINWTSSAPSIASVDQNGTITAKAPGKATITCAATDGSNKKATCAVTVSVPMSKLVIGPTDGNEGTVAVGKNIKMAAKYYGNYGTPSSNKIDWTITGYGNAALNGKVKIDTGGKVSVDKNLTLPSTNAYVTVQASAKDGSGVKSNEYRIYIKKTYLKARIILTKYGYIIQGSTLKNPKKESDWEWVPDYCTATLSSSKQCGMEKDAGRIENDPTNSVYAAYTPIPNKTSSNSALLGDALGRVPMSVIKKECDKMTLNIKLKDGSNLSAKKTFYAVYYVNSSGKKSLYYYE